MYTDLKLFFDKMNPLKRLEWELFKSNTKTKAFQKGEIITREGQIENYLYFISKGGTRIFYLKEGNETNIDFRFENQFTSSYASFLTQTPSRQYIEAIEDSVLYAINYKALQKMYGLSKNGERLGRINAQDLFLEKEMHEASLMLDTPEERFNQLFQNKKHWLQRVPQKQIASYLNMTPETFSRIKKRSLGK